MAENLGKQKLLLRIRRIRGQFDGIERALLEDQSTFKILQSAAACRGALDGLMGEIITAHIEAVAEPNTSKIARHQGAKELIDIVHTYLK